MDKYKFVFHSVPVNWQLMGPYLAGLMLGCRYGFFSQIIYILLGVLGIPVFAGFTSGAGIIAGAHRRFYRRLRHMRSHMRPASQKKRFVLSYHADDMRPYSLLRLRTGLVYDPHSLYFVGRPCGLHPSVSAG